ncbi:hypothetical protein GN958_ATG01507 [Phytophthora infestans]|uniref:Uncharacterized protein n=1 Tax=Phytophthora infestans TaxID=4787 RepID=A0A8S9V6R6_PHYIN|nr:hypothetical protein GN958_ATG01507 [Phytophthora infestans]
MEGRLNVAKNNIIPDEVNRVAWVYRKKAVLQEILSVTVRPAKSKNRKTITATGRLLTRELI